MANVNVRSNITTGTQPTAITVTDSATTILAAPTGTQQRKAFVIQNVGGTDCYFCLDGTDPTTSDGFLLVANGGSYSMDAPGHVEQALIRGIVGSGSTTVMVWHKTV